MLCNLRLRFPARLARTRRPRETLSPVWTIDALWALTVRSVHSQAIRSDSKNTDVLP